MLLSGLMLKMALYGIFRFVIPITPLAVEQWGSTIMVLAVIGVVYGAWIAIAQNNIKTLFAYSSLSHVGLIAAGMFTLTTQGLQGGLFQMVAHGFNAVGLFMVADILGRRLGTYDLTKMGGIARQAPKFAILFFIILLGAVALPLTNGFVGEFLLLLGIFSYSKVMAAIAGLTIILGAVYMLNTYQKSMFGEANETTANFKDLTVTEMLVLVPIAVIILGAGIFPELFMKLTELPVESMLAKLTAGAVK
jgi:NADH-quinone oxidoreductase subunit M